MSARILTAPLALAGGLLLTSPALAQDPAPQPIVAPPGGVVVVLPSQPPPVVAPPAYPPGYAPPPAFLPPYPPPYPYLPPAAAPPPLPDESAQRGFSAKISFGPAYQRIFDSGIAGGELGIFFGAVRGTSGWYGGTELLVGRMDQGLFTYVLRPGATWEARLGRVHIGLGLNFNIIGVQRATTGEYMLSGGAGASVFGTVDLVRSERNALFLGAKLRADVVAGSDANGNAPILWGPSAALGWRYF